MGGSVPVITGFADTTRISVVCELCVNMHINIPTLLFYVGGFDMFIYLAYMCTCACFWACFGQASVRAAVGIVPQDTVLFNDTILHNIR